MGKDTCPDCGKPMEMYYKRFYSQSNSVEAVMSVYFENFDDKEDVIGAFEVHEPLDDANILFAWYEYEDYNGNAYVLFERGGKLFEVHGGHCSCYGLEGQWEPEETHWGAIKYQRDHGNSYMSPDADAALDKLVKDHFGSLHDDLCN